MNAYYPYTAKELIGEDITILERPFKRTKKRKVFNVFCGIGKMGV
jgi:hypothetical protein